MGKMPELETGILVGPGDVPVVTDATDVSETFAEGDAALSTIGSFVVSDVDTTDLVTITNTAIWLWPMP